MIRSERNEGRARQQFR